jgi:hypothetical protein
VPGNPANLAPITKISLIFRNVLVAVSWWGVGASFLYPRMKIVFAKKNWPYFDFIYKIIQKKEGNRKKMLNVIQ